MHIGVETEEVLERWCFDVDTDQQVLETGYSNLYPYPPYQLYQP